MSGVRVTRHDHVVQARLKDAVPEALNKAAEVLRGWSVLLAPVDMGDLRGSAQVTPATAGNPQAWVSFDTVYAARQHEELGWYHTEGQAKYLEEPVTERADELMAIIAQEIQWRLGL